MRGVRPPRGTGVRRVSRISADESSDDDEKEPGTPVPDMSESLARPRHAVADMDADAAAAIDMGLDDLEREEEAVEDNVMAEAAEAAVRAQETAAAAEAAADEVIAAATEAVAAVEAGDAKGDDEDDVQPQRRRNKRKKRVSRFMDTEAGCDDDDSGDDDEEDEESDRGERKSRGARGRGARGRGRGGDGERGGRGRGRGRGGEGGAGRGAKRRNAGADADDDAKEVANADGGIFVPRIGDGGTVKHDIFVAGMPQIVMPPELGAAAAAKGAILVWPHTEQLARFTRRRIRYTLEKKGCSADPFVLFIPASDFCGRTLLDVDEQTGTGRWNRACLMLLLAQTVRGHGTLIAHATMDTPPDSYEGTKPIWTGYYFFLYPLAKAHPNDGTDEARAAESKAYTEAHAAVAILDGLERVDAAGVAIPDGRTLNQKLRDSGAPARASTETLSVMGWVRRRLGYVVWNGRGIATLKELELPNARMADTQAARNKTEMSAEQTAVWLPLVNVGSSSQIRVTTQALHPIGGVVPSPVAGGGDDDDDVRIGDGVVAAAADDEMPHLTPKEAWELQKREREIPDLQRTLFAPVNAARACVMARNATFGKRHVDEKSIDAEVAAEFAAMKDRGSAANGIFPPWSAELRATYERYARRVCVETKVAELDDVQINDIWTRMARQLDTGANTFRYPRSLAHPLIVVQYAQPHLTPPVDVTSSTYMEAYTRMRVNPIYGRTQPSAEFHKYFMNMWGTTSKYVDGTDLEDVINGLRARAKRNSETVSSGGGGGGGVLARIQATAAIADRLDNLLLGNDTAKLPDGIRHAVTLLGECRHSGQSLTDFLAGRLLLHDHTRNLMGDFCSLLMGALDIGFTMTHLHLYALVLWLLAINSGYDPIFGPLLQARILISGYPGSGKSFMSRVMVDDLCMYCQEITMETAKTLTTSEPLRGVTQFRDEEVPERFDAGQATSARETREAVRNNLQVRSTGSHSSIAATNTTHARPTIVHFDWIQQPNGTRTRASTTTKSTRLTCEVGCANWSGDLIAERLWRRTWTWDVVMPPESKAGLITSSREGHNTSGPRRKITQGIRETCRRVHALVQVDNTLTATGAKDHTLDAFTEVYDGGVKLPSMREIGPYHKARMLLVSMINMTGALRIGPMRMAGPDPLRPITPCRDMLYARAFAYARVEEAAAVIDVVFGPMLGQVSRPGMMYAVVGLRKLFSVDGSRARGDNATMMLTTPPADMFPDADKYAMIRGFFQGAQSGDDKATSLASTLVSITKSGVLPQTMQVCVTHLTTDTEDLQGDDEKFIARALQPILILGHAGDPTALFTLKSFLLRPPTGAADAVHSMAFEPGTRGMWFRTKLDVDMDDPATLKVHTRTRESVGKAIFMTRRLDAVVNTSTAFVAYNDAVSVLVRTIAAVCDRVRIGSGVQKLQHAFLSIDPNTRLESDYQVMELASGILRTKFGQTNNEIANIRRNGDVRAAVKEVINARVNYWDQRTLEFAAQAECTQLASTAWYEQRLHNPAFVDNAAIQKMISMGWVDADDVPAFTSEEKCAMTHDVFTVCAVSHLRDVCGVRAYLAPYHAAYPANASMLEYTSQRVNASVAAVRAATKAYADKHASVERAVTLMNRERFGDPADYSDAELDGYAPPETDLETATRADRVTWLLQCRAAQVSEWEFDACNAQLDPDTVMARGETGGITPWDVLYNARRTYCRAWAKLALDEAAFMWRLRSTLGGLNYPLTLSRCAHLISTRVWNVTTTNSSGPYSPVSEYTCNTLAAFLFTVIARLVYDRNGCAPPLDPLATAWIPETPVFGGRVRKAERLRMVAEDARRAHPDNPRAADAAEAAALAAAESTPEMLHANDTEALSVDPTARFTLERLHRSGVVAVTDEDGHARTAMRTYTEPRESACPRNLQMAVNRILAPPEPLPPTTALDSKKKEEKHGMMCARAAAAILCRPDAWHDVAGHAELDKWETDLRKYRESVAELKGQCADASLGKPPTRPPRMSDAAMTEFYDTTIDRLEAVNRAHLVLMEQLSWALMSELQWCEHKDSRDTMEKLNKKLAKVVAKDMDATLHARAAAQMCVSLTIQAGFAASVPRIEKDIEAMYPGTPWRMPACANADPSENELPMLAVVMGRAPLDAFIIERETRRQKVAEANPVPSGVQHGWNIPDYPPPPAVVGDDPCAMATVTAEDEEAVFGESKYPQTTTSASQPGAAREPIVIGGGGGEDSREGAGTSAHVSEHSSSNDEGRPLRIIDEDEDEDLVPRRMNIPNGPPPPPLRPVVIHTSQPRPLTSPTPMQQFFDERAQSGFGGGGGGGTRHGESSPDTASYNLATVQGMVDSVSRIDFSAMPDETTRTMQRAFEDAVKDISRR